MGNGLLIWLVLIPFLEVSVILVFLMIFIFLTILIFIIVKKICKDKVEAELWFAGLKSLISSGQYGRTKIDGWSDGGFSLDVNDLPYAA